MSQIFFEVSDMSTSALIVLGLSLGLVAYAGYGAIWRLYLSPIAHFPGPRFAALTFWNEFYYDVYLGGKYTWKLLEYHERYGSLGYISKPRPRQILTKIGPIIRINPYEIHINDPEFYDEIYHGASKGKTDKWFWSVGKNSSQARHPR